MADFHNARDRSSVDRLLIVQEVSQCVLDEEALAEAWIRHARTQIETDQARGKLDAMARSCDYAIVQRTLRTSASDGTTDLPEFLKRLCAALRQAALRERGILLSVAATKSLPLASSHCWRVAFIVAELIANAARHGLSGGGSIVVMLDLMDDTVLCRVVDNGGVIQPPIPSRGMSSVKALSADLRGEVAWIFGKHGTRVELRFPRASGTDEPRTSC